MSILRFTIIMYCFMEFSSCSNRSISDGDIDKFISIHHNETFSDFMGISITYRGSDFSDNIYMISKQGAKFPPYIVHFNKKKDEITSIDNRLLVQSSCEEYFTKNEIKQLMAKFVGFNVFNLSVDSGGNVFISPFYAEHSPILLRLNIGENEKSIKKGYAYELYKDNWYIKR
jgi:hypothetical protein